MNTSDELIGKLVLVHPQLTNDPTGKAGQVGIITGTDLDHNDVYVGFGKNGQGKYPPEALLTLRPSGEIKKVLQEKMLDLNVDNYKALFQISLLQDFRPSTANIKTAMSLALQNDTVLNNSMTTLEQILPRQQNQFVER